MTETVYRTALGNVPEGPERWKRARLNAEARPTSGGAKLYRKREQLAAQLEQQFLSHRQQAFTVLRPTDWRGDRHRKLNVCSVECLGFQIQLEVGETKGATNPTLSDYTLLVSRAFDQSGTPVTHTWVPRRSADAARQYERTLTIVTLDTATLERSVTCRVCGTSIVGDKQAVKAIAAATEAVQQYVLINGVFVQVAYLTVVDLTDHDRALLSQYSTPELRAAYVEQHGHRFDA